MQRLVTGIHHFSNHIFRTQKDLFQRLKGGQSPSCLFITCSDSRINPNLFTQTEPGELFIVRNAGNIIPAHPICGGEIATIEFAIKELGIEDLIICGHSDCGAMKALKYRDQIGSKLPMASEWLGHASRTMEIMNHSYQHITDPQDFTTATAEENVIVQIENLRTHSFIEERLNEGSLKLHAWMYKFEIGRVFSFDPHSGQFIDISSFKTTVPLYSKNNVRAQLGS